MRAFRHACQPRAVLALAKSITIKPLFSHTALAMRTSTMNPHTSRAPQTAGHTKCPFSNDDWCLRAFGWKKPRTRGMLTPPYLHHFVLKVEYVIILIYQLYSYNAIVETTYFFTIFFSSFLKLKYAIYSHRNFCESDVKTEKNCINE